MNITEQIHRQDLERLQLLRYMDDDFSPHTGSAEKPAEAFSMSMGNIAVMMKLEDGCTIFPALTPMISIINDLNECMNHLKEHIQ